MIFLLFWIVLSIPIGIFVGHAISINSPKDTE
jgi:hypothetical protein